MLADALDRLAGRRLLVVGDVILDRYITGSVDRISPEAPVPVVRVRGREHRPGGAANVAANIAALGGEPHLVGVVGDDPLAEKLVLELRARHLDVSGLVVAPGRTTTVKTRVIAQGQQVLRLDEETDEPAPGAAVDQVIALACAELARADAVVVSDYAKGLVDARLLHALLGDAHARGIPVVIDPKRRDLSVYQPATVLTPNLAEAARALGEDPRDSDPETLAARLLDTLGVGAVLVTLGERGMLLARRGQPALRIPAAAREVFDVTGAGDTVVAVIAAALASALPLDVAARLANAAAAISVGRVGTAAITRDDLRTFLGQGSR